MKNHIGIEKTSSNESRNELQVAPLWWKDCHVRGQHESMAYLA